MVVGWVVALVVRWVVCLARWWLNGNGDFGICFEMENSGQTGRGKRQKTEEEVKQKKRKSNGVFFFFFSLFKFRDKIIFLGRNW